MNDSSQLAEWILEQTTDALVYADRDEKLPAGIRQPSHCSATAQPRPWDKPRAIIPERLRAAHWKGFDSAMASGSTRLAGRPAVTRAAHKNGEKLYVEMTFAVVKESSGHGGGIRSDREGCHGAGAAGAFGFAITTAIASHSLRCGTRDERDLSGQVETLRLGAGGWAAGQEDQRLMSVLRSMTRPTKPYSTASSAESQRSRSILINTASSGLPVSRAIVARDAFAGLDYFLRMDRDVGRLAARAATGLVDQEAGVGRAIAPLARHGQIQVRGRAADPAGSNHVHRGADRWPVRVMMPKASIWQGMSSGRMATMPCDA